MSLQNIELFNNIPAELKALNQWACIKHGEKRPINPNTSRYVSVTDSTAFCSFEDALTGVRSETYEGLGLVLTENDPFAVIDLDVKKGQQVTQEQQEISEYFSDSYQERSINGDGLHIVCNCDELFAGKRKEGIEIYSKERFIIFTGKLYKNKPISNRTEDLKKLRLHLNNGETKQDLPTVFNDQPATKSDDEVKNLVLSGPEAKKWEDLASDGNWQGKYPSQSEADQALMNRIAYFSKNENQTKRLFLSSALANTLNRKSNQDYYLAETVKKAFANINKYELPKIDCSAIQNQIKSVVQKAANDSSHESDVLNLKNLLHLAKTSPDIEFTIPLLTPRQEVTLLSANGGVGKSYFALQTAISLVTGDKFFDLPSFKHDLHGLQPPQKCLFVTAEDTKLVCAKRLQTICESQYLPESTFDNFHLMEMIGKPLWLEDKSNKQGVPTLYMNELKNAIDKIKPDQIFIDNASSVFAGNPNDNVQVTAFINHLRKVAEINNCNIMLLAHVNADNAIKGAAKTYFGSVAWHNAVRSRIYMKIESSNLGEYISVVHEKSNYGKLHKPFKLKRNHDNGLLSLLSDMEIAHTIDSNISNLADELLEDIKVMTDKKEYLYCATSGQKTFYHCLNNSFPDKYKEGDKMRKNEVKMAINKLKEEGRISSGTRRNEMGNYVSVWIPTPGFA